jgi:hypothetical protein
MIFYSVLSAVAEKLSVEFDLGNLIWVDSIEFILKSPRFGMEVKGNLRLVLLIESPIEFKARNIFVSANALARV